MAESLERCRRWKDVRVAQCGRREDRRQQQASDRRAEVRVERLHRADPRLVHEIDPGVGGSAVRRPFGNHVRVDPQLPAFLGYDVVGGLTRRVGDDVCTVAVPRHAPERLGRGDLCGVSLRVERADERPEREEEFPHTLELAAHVGVERVAHHDGDGADHLRGAVEQGELPWVFLEQREELRPRRRAFPDPVVR